MKYFLFRFFCRFFKQELLLNFTTKYEQKLYLYVYKYGGIYYAYIDNGYGVIVSDFYSKSIDQLSLDIITIQSKENDTRCLYYRNFIEETLFMYHGDEEGSSELGLVENRKKLTEKEKKEFLSCLLRYYRMDKKSIKSLTDENYKKIGRTKNILRWDDTTYFKI